MTLVYIYSGNYDGFKNVLRLAKMRALCRIVVVDQPKDYGSWSPIISLPAYKLASWLAPSLARWFVLREMIQKKEVELPVFCSDWDVMLFSPLASAYAPFDKFDYSVSIVNGCSSAAYCISNMESLDTFCEQTWKLFCDPAKTAVAINDMDAWKNITATGQFKVGNLFDIVDDTVFDHNITCGEDRFRMEDGMKEIRWVDNFPFFVALDGRLIKAHTIHCWGPLKTKTGDLMKKAGF